MSTIVLRVVVETGRLHRNCGRSEPTGAARFHSEPIYGTGHTQARSGHAYRRRDARGEDPVVSSDQRRRQLAREKFERQQQRRQRPRDARHAAQRGDRVGARPWSLVAAPWRAYASGRLDGRRQGATRARRTPSADAQQGAGPVREAGRGQGRDADLEEGAGDVDRQVGEVHVDARRRPAATIDDRAGRGEGPAHRELLQLPRGQGLLRPHQVPPADHAGHLRAAVRRPEGHRHAAAPATRSRTRT